MIKLERLIIYPLLAVIALAAFLDLRPLQAQKEPGEAVFRKLTIVDEKGRPAIILGVSEGEEVLKGTGVRIGAGPEIKLFDEKGNEGISLSTIYSEGKAKLKLSPRGVDLIDENGIARASLFLIEGRPRLQLQDANMKSKVSLIQHDGFSVLAFVDENGNVKASLQESSLLLSGPSPSLSLSDEKSKMGISLGMIAGSPSMSFRDQNGKERIGLWTYSSLAGISPPSPRLTLSDEKGEERVSLELQKGEPRLRLKDGLGNVRWSAP